MAVKRAIDTRRPAGTVVVSVTTKAPPTRAYAALTDPALTARWFGELSEPLRAGARARLDFGDGDFFTIEDVMVDPPHVLAYRWQFLGLMPHDTVEWTVAPARGGGSEVTVSDADPLRSAEECQMLRDGWQDFTSRLVAFCDTGETARYDWRRTFDGGVELPWPPAQALAFAAGSNAADWLPIEPGLRQGARITPDDGAEPSVVTLTAVSRDDPGTVRFTLASPEWRDVTACAIEARPRGAGTMLTVSHAGWEAVSEDEEAQRRERRRFAAFWIASLHRLSTRAAGRAA